MKYLLYSVLFVLIGCSSSINTILVTNSGQAQGSYYHIKYMSEDGLDYSFQIDSILLEIDSSLSLYKSYSVISRLNNKELVRTDSMFNTVFLASKKIFNQTDGYFDCSVSPLVKYYGFYNLGYLDSVSIDSSKVRNIVSNIGLDKINIYGDSLDLPKNMKIDFNAIAQGYTVDLISEFLLDQNISNFLVEVGGELLARGLNADNLPWRVGVDKPSDTLINNNRFQFIIDLKNKALATSGNYRKFYVRNGNKYSHTINPKTGFPAQNNLLSVSVVHNNCMLADAYATAFMAMGVDKTKKFVFENSEIEIYLVYTSSNGNWKTYCSPKILERIVN
ncbi:MAG: FAD:protein FMN transferase [Flavobacteriales bacterium]|nr:FAD:protein FMN transferase [Flavobacteriales bacterium]